MNNQILDDLDNIRAVDTFPEIANWKYRIVGIFRLLLGLTMFGATLYTIYVNTLDFQNAQSRAGNAELNINADLIIFSVTAFVTSSVFMIPFIYHINQGWAEVQLKEPFKQRRFRTFGMFIIALLTIGITFEFSPIYYHIFTAIPNGFLENIQFYISNILQSVVLLLMFISIFWMDFKYYTFHKKAKR